MGLGPGPGQGLGIFAYCILCWNFTLQLMWELKMDQDLLHLTWWAYEGIYSNLYECSRSFFKLQCEVFDILLVPTPVPSMLCLSKPLTVPLWARASGPAPWSSVDAYRLGSPGSPVPDSTPSPPGTASAASDPRSPRSPSSCHGKTVS